MEDPIVNYRIDTIPEQEVILKDHCKALVKTRGEHHTREHFFLHGDLDSTSPVRNIVQFTEGYYDDKDNTLLRKNCWLFLRRTSLQNERWGLKELVSTSLTTLNYRFYVDKGPVVKRLGEIFNLDFPTGDPRDHFAVCFAFFTTHRLRFDTELWWIDCCDFGVSDGFYLVGTIDVPPLSTPRSAIVRELIKDEFAIHVPAPSKVIAYLRKRFPHILRNVWPPVSPAVTQLEQQFGYVKKAPFPTQKPFGMPYPYDNSGEEASDDEMDGEK